MYKRRRKKYRLPSDLKSRVTTTARKVEALLKGQTLSRRVYDQDEGRLDTSALYKVKIPAERRVFYSVRKGIDIDTCAFILIDCSGSMNHRDGGRRRFEWASIAANFVAEILNRVGIPFAAAGFTTAGDIPYSGGYSVREHSLWNVYKTFEDPFRKVGIEATAESNNMDGDEVLHASRILASRKEKRKILVVISDGYPAHFYGSGHPNERLKSVLKTVQSNGIEVLGIGVGTSGADAVKSFYDINIPCNDVRTLPDNVLKGFSDLLKNYNYRTGSR